MTSQTLILRPVLLSNDLWSKVVRAAAAESVKRGVVVPPEDWICEHLDTEPTFMVWADKPAENPN